MLLLQIATAYQVMGCDQFMGCDSGDLQRREGTSQASCPRDSDVHFNDIIIIQ